MRHKKYEVERHSKKKMILTQRATERKKALNIWKRLRQYYLNLTKIIMKFSSYENSKIELRTTMKERW